MKIVTAAEGERMIKLMEEMAEAIKVICKILNHGWSPTAEGVTYDNRADLELELGDVRYWMIKMCERGDLSKDAIRQRADDKHTLVQPYLHHQD